MAKGDELISHFFFQKIFMPELSETFRDVHRNFTLKRLCDRLFDVRENRDALNDLAARVIEALREHSDTLLTTEFRTVSLLLTALRCNHLALTEAILRACSVDLMRHQVRNVAPLDLATALAREDSPWNAVVLTLRARLYPVEIGARDGEITELRDTVGRHANRITELETDLQAEKDDRQADVSRLQDQLQTAQADVSRLQDQLQTQATDHAAEMQALRTELGLPPRSPVSQSAGAAEPGTPPHVPVQPRPQTSPGSAYVTRRELDNAIRAGAARAPSSQLGLQQRPPRGFYWAMLPYSP